MMSFWNILRYLPAGAQTATKRLTSAKFRLWVRESFGGSHRSIPDEIVSVADGRRFHIGPDPIYWPLSVGLEFEPEASSIVRRLVGPGNVVLDLGANYGWYTTLLGQVVGSGGCVHAFEPVPATFERLLEHIELNEMGDRVIANRCAVGKERGEMDIHIFEGLSASRSSLSTLGQDSYSTFPTPVIDLDTYLAEHDLAVVNFLKCDVEGAELMVLEGARRLLASREAPPILIELNRETSAAFGYEPRAIWVNLREVGYDRFYDLNGVDSVRLLETEAQIAGCDLLLCGKGDLIEALLA